MALTAASNMQSQFVLETTPGVAPGAGFKRLQSISVVPMTKAEVQRYRPEGIRFDTLALLNKEWSAWKISGVPCYNEVSYLLELLKTVTATTPAGATTARSRLYDPASSGPITRKTATLERGDGSTFVERASYGVLDALNFKFTRTSMEVGGAAFARRLYDNHNDAISLTGGATTVAQKPIASTHVCIYLADSFADLDAATALTLPFSVEWGLSNLCGPVFGLNRADGYSFGDVVDLVPAGTAKLRLPVNAASYALKNTMRTGATTFMRIEAIGDEIETDHDNSFVIDTALKVSAEPSEPGDDQGALAIDIPFTFAHDGTGNKGFDIELINALASL